MCNLAGNLKVFCLFQIKQKLIIRLSCRQKGFKGFTGRKQILGEQRTNSFHSHTSGKLLQHCWILPHQSDWDILTSQGAMAGLAVKGCRRAVLSCTCSTAGFQNSRNEVQALLAEGFENSSVWSQHVTKGIINVLYSITPFVTFWNQSRSPFGWLRSRASDFPARWYPEAPKAKKSC